MAVLTGPRAMAAPASGSGLLANIFGSASLGPEQIAAVLLGVLLGSVAPTIESAKRSERLRSSSPTGPR